MGQVELPFGLSEQFDCIPPTLKKGVLATYLILLIEFCGTLVSNFCNYWQACNESQLKKRFALTSFLSHYGYMWINIIIYNYYGALSGSNILQTHPRLVVFCFAGQFL